MMMYRRLLLAAAFGAAAPAVLAQTKPDDRKVAIGGYDTVAYFVVGKPQKGDSAIAYVWDGRRFLFANDQHRQLFVANPDKYAPQFAGHCTSGLAIGAKVEADPQNWIISDGRLFLFSGPAGPDGMRADASLAGKAEAGWQKLK
jgi:YHS domain-containing protein